MAPTLRRSRAHDGQSGLWPDLDRGFGKGCFLGGPRGVQAMEEICFCPSLPRRDDNTRRVKWVGQTPARSLPDRHHPTYPPFKQGTEMRARFPIHEVLAEQMATPVLFQEVLEMIEVYHYSNSICSERVRMTLNEKGLTNWTSHHIDLFKGEQFDPAYIKINPKAETPTLVDDGHIIRESALICEYLNDAYPEPSLSPEKATEKAEMRELVKLSDDTLYEAVASLSFVSIFRTVLNAKGPEEKEAHFRSQTDLARIMRQRSCVEDGFASPYVIRGVNNLKTLVTRLEDRLADGRTWLMGDSYGLAEIAYTPFLARLAALGFLGHMLCDRPNLSRWWTHCMARPSYLAAEVGPAKGADADRYHEAGSRCQSEFEALLRRLDREHPYDLATP